MDNRLKLKSLSVFLSIVLSFSGCSTISGRQNGYDYVRFDSNIPGVEVTCSGQRVFTPASLQLKRSEDHSCRAEKKGYEPQSFNLHSGSGGRGFGASTGANFLLGLFTLGAGLILGWLIDWPSGAMRNLKEKEIFLEMKQVS